MKITRYLQSRLHAFRSARARQQLRHQYCGTANEITRERWAESLQEPTVFYTCCCHYFDRRLPEELREHRNYFTQNRRGFGEDAFHVMWYFLFREFRPTSFLEIGVFRGQSLSLAAMLSRQFNLGCFIQGISPFSSLGDAVSQYRTNVDYYADTLKNFARFKLPAPALLRALSTDESAIELIASRAWSIVYIDGNHDYEVAKHDWELCAAHLQPSGIIVLDDAGLTTTYRPPAFATKGHPGPSKLAQEIQRSQFRELLQVGHNRVFQKTS
jgi:hypothetical protein